MKTPKFAKVIFAFIFFLLSASNLFSQSGWFDLNVPYSLRCLYFVSDQTGWAVGWDGRIIKTINGGINWTVQTTNPSYILNSVYFPSNSVGYTVGYANGGGIAPIFKTSNGGTNWILLNSNTTVVLTSVYFTSTNDGWIVGDSSVILHTTNGGNNWNFVSSSGTNYYTCVQFVSPNTGWITGGGTILKTTNGGVNWFNQPAPSYSQLWEARFPTPLIGYAVCGITSPPPQGYVIKTTDGGNSWDSLNIYANSYLIYLSLVNENLGWVTGLDGTILRTTDGGQSWEQQSAGQAGWLQSVQFINSQTGWLTASNSIYKTVTGGEVGIIPISNEVPKNFSLFQNYPNPFNPATMITFALPKDAFIKITLYDIIGREIQTLASEFKKAGSYKLEFNAKALSTGTYFYRLEAGEFVDTKKMVLIK